MRISFELNLDDEQGIQQLGRLARALNNVPPTGLRTASGPMETPPPDVTVHAPPTQAAQAQAAVNTAPGATVAADPLPDPVAAPTLTEEQIKATGQRLRELLLSVTKMPGKDINTAKQIAAAAAGVPVEKIDKDFPAHPNVAAAIGALEHALVG